MNANFSLPHFPFPVVTIEPCRQPKINDFGKHLLQLPPVQGPEVIVTAVDGLAGGWVGFALYTQASSLFFDEVRENIFVLEGH